MTDLIHREELGTLFKESQSAIAKGDLEALAEASAEGFEAEIDALVAELPT